ncbi:WXG100-like domain-containing protein [Streptacidiphilus fuscans]|uniref:Outer membrane channel protein CpnT-like N-terminal domain-containing protein n=1 Tax=Streptacidiphilus fuscans TaxID=2789292 RepID=A0A931B9C0_9ACTN|nr:hypothetical protein [Streptacidiphilus fuscans]MBF9072568.1 hypothetical protein [Streptacidiphilus fuscans]
MATTLSDDLKNMLAIIGGQQCWPTIDPDGMRVVAADYADLAEAFPDLRSSIQQLTEWLSENFQGQAGTAFVESMQSLVGSTDGSDPLASASDQLRQLSEYAKQTAEQVEYSQLMIIAQLVDLLLNALDAYALAPIDPAALFELAWDYAATRAELGHIAEWLLEQVMKPAFHQAIKNIEMDLVVQGIQIAEGHRDGIDTSSLLSDLENAGINALLEPVMHTLGGAIGGVVTKLLGHDASGAAEKDLTKTLDGTADGGAPVDEHATPGESTPAPTEAGAGAGAGAGAPGIGDAAARDAAAQELARSVTLTTEEAQAFASSYLAPEAAAAFTRDLDAVAKETLGQLGGAVSEAEQTAVADAFGQSMGEVFATHLGVGPLSAEAARNIGEDFGRTLSDQWRADAEHGALDSASTGSAARLDSVAPPLGTPAKVPSGLVAHLSTKTGNGLAFRLGMELVGYVQAGAQNTLASAVMNAVNGQGFTADYTAFVSGMAMGLIGRGVHLVTEPLNHWYHAQLENWRGASDDSGASSSTAFPSPSATRTTGGDPATGLPEAAPEAAPGTPETAPEDVPVERPATSSDGALEPPKVGLGTEDSATMVDEVLGKSGLSPLATESTGLDESLRPSESSQPSASTDLPPDAPVKRATSSSGGEPTESKTKEPGPGTPERTASASASTSATDTSHEPVLSHPTATESHTTESHTPDPPSAVPHTTGLHTPEPSPDNSPHDGPTVLHLPSGAVVGAQDRSNASAGELLDVVRKMQNLGVLPDHAADELKAELQPLVEKDLAKKATVSAVIGPVKGRPPAKPAVVPLEVAEKLLAHVESADHVPLSPEHLNDLGVEVSGSVGEGGVNDPADVAKLRTFLEQHDVPNPADSAEALAHQLLMHHISGGLDDVPGRAGRRVSSLLDTMAKSGTTMKWDSSGAESETRFSAWARNGAPKDEAPPLSEETSANCWEAVMLAGYHEGVLSSEWIAETYQSEDTEGKPWHVWLATRLLPYTRSLYVEGTKEPKPGQIVVLGHNSQHVAIVVEGRDPEGKVKVVGLGWTSPAFENEDVNKIAYASIDDMAGTIYFGNGPFHLPDNAPLTRPDGSVIDDSAVQTHQLSDPTGKPFGRAVFPESDWEYRKDLYKELTSLDHYEQRPDWSTPTGDVHEVPWDPKNVYVFADHHDARGFHLETDDAGGSTSDVVDGRQLGGLLNRRPSLADLKQAQRSGSDRSAAKPASIVLLSCESAADAQAVADRTGMVVHAATGKTGLVGKDPSKPFDSSAGAVLYVKPGPGGKPGTFDTFRPRTTGGHAAPEPPRTTEHAPTQHTSTQHTSTDGRSAGPNPDNGPDDERVNQMTTALTTHQAGDNHLLHDGPATSRHASVLPRFPKDDRFFTVAMHTDKDGWPIWRGVRVTPAELARTIAELYRTGVWDGKKPLQLTACDLGTDRNASHAAETLAELRTLVPDLPLKAFVPEGPLYFTPAVRDDGLDQEGEGHLVVGLGVLNKFGQPHVLVSPDTGWLEMSLEPHSSELNITELSAHLPVDGSMPPNSKAAPEGYGHVVGSGKAGGALSFGPFGRRRSSVVTGVEEMKVAQHPLDTPRHAEGDRTPDPFNSAADSWRELADHRRELAELRADPSNASPERQARISKLERDISRKQGQLGNAFGLYLRAGDKLLQAGAARREKEIEKLRTELAESSGNRSPQWQVEHTNARLSHLNSELLDIQSELSLRPARSRQDMVVSARDLQLVEELRTHGQEGLTERLSEELGRATKLAEGAPENPLYALDLKRAQQDVDLFAKLAHRTDWSRLDPASAAALVLAERKGLESAAREHDLLVTNLRNAKGEWAWAAKYPTGTDEEVNALIDAVTRHMHDDMGVATNFYLDSPLNANRNLKDGEDADTETLLDKLIADPQQLFRNAWETGASQAAVVEARRGSVEERMGYPATLKRDPSTRHLFQNTDSEESKFDPEQRELLPKYGALVSTKWQPRGVAPRYGAFVMHWKPEIRGSVTHTPRDSWSAGRLGSRSFTSDSHLLPLLNHGDPEQVRFTVAAATGFQHDPEFGARAAKSGLTTDSYFETQLHGPVHWSDLKKITINHQGPTGGDPENRGKLPTQERAEQLKARIEAHAAGKGYDLTVELRQHDAPPPGATDPGHGVDPEADPEGAPEVEGEVEGVVAFGGERNEEPAPPPPLSSDAADKTGAPPPPGTTGTTGATGTSTPGAQSAGPSHANGPSTVAVTEPHDSAQVMRDLLDSSVLDRLEKIDALSGENRRWLAQQPAFVDELRGKLPPQAFARAAAHLMVDLDHRVTAMPSARAEARRQVERMLQDPEVATSLLTSGANAVVIPRDVKMTEVDPYRFLAGVRISTADNDRRLWDYVRGSGGKNVAVTEENLTGDHTSVTAGSKHYPEGYSTTTHEFAHVIQDHGLSAADRQAVTDVYQAKLQDPAAVWPDGSGAENYSRRDEREFFAQLTNTWLGTNHGFDPYTNEQRNNGAEWVRLHEPSLVPLLERLYGVEPESIHDEPANQVRANTGQYEDHRLFWEGVAEQYPDAGRHVPTASEAVDSGSDGTSDSASDGPGTPDSQRSDPFGDHHVASDSERSDSEHSDPFGDQHRAASDSERSDSEGSLSDHESTSPPPPPPPPVALSNDGVHRTFGLSEQQHATLGEFDKLAGRLPLQHGDDLLLDAMRGGHSEALLDEETGEPLSKQRIRADLAEELLGQLYGRNSFSLSEISRYEGHPLDDEAKLRIRDALMDDGWHPAFDTVVPHLVEQVYRSRVLTLSEDGRFRDPYGEVVDEWPPDDAVIVAKLPEQGGRSDLVVPVLPHSWSHEAEPRDELGTWTADEASGAPAPAPAPATESRSDSAVQMTSAEPGHAPHVSPATHEPAADHSAMASSAERSTVEQPSVPEADGLAKLYGGLPGGSRLFYRSDEEEARDRWAQALDRNPSLAEHPAVRAVVSDLTSDAAALRRGAFQVLRAESTRYRFTEDVRSHGVEGVNRDVDPVVKHRRELAQEVELRKGIGDDTPVDIEYEDVPGRSAESLREAAVTLAALRRGTRAAEDLPGIKYDPSYNRALRLQRRILDAYPVLRLALRRGDHALVEFAEADDLSAASDALLDELDGAATGDDLSSLRPEAESLLGTGRADRPQPLPSGRDWNDPTVAALASVLLEHSGADAHPTESPTESPTGSDFAELQPSGHDESELLSWRQQMDEAPGLLRDLDAHSGSPKDSSSLRFLNDLGVSSGLLLPHPTPRDGTSDATSFAADPEKFFEVVDSARTRTDGKVPFIKADNVLGGGKGRAFGLELTFTFPHTMPEDVRQERLRAIGETLVKKGLATRPDLYQQNELRNEGYTTARNGNRLESEQRVAAELVTTILHDTKEDWQALEDICTSVEEFGGIAPFGEGGAHVNISLGDFGAEGHEEVIRKFKENEDALYRFAHHPLTDSHRGTRHCQPNDEPPRNGFHSLADLTNPHNGRYWAVQMAHSVFGKASRGEFRLWGASVDPGTLQSYVRLSAGLVDWAANSTFHHGPTTSASREPVGSHRAKAGDGRELSGEDFAKDTESVRRFIDEMAHDEAGRNQLATLFGMTRWQKDLTQEPTAKLTYQQLEDAELRITSQAPPQAVDDYILSVLSGGGL